MEDEPASEQPRASAPRRKLFLRFLPGAAFGSLLFAVYLANGRGVAEGDLSPATLLPIAILRGDGPYLDRFAPLFGRRGERSHAVAYARGHLVSRYPLAPALAALPFTAVQMVVLDRVRPGWDQRNLLFFALFMAKTSHALIAACAGVLLLVLCLRTGASPPVAWISATAGALGSTLWSVASQGAWQHGLAVLGFAAALCLLWDGDRSDVHSRSGDRPRFSSSGDRSRFSWSGDRSGFSWSGGRSGAGRLLLAGFFTAAMVAARSFDVVFAAALAGFVLAAHRWRAWPFFVFPLLVGGALLAYNLAFFGALEGGQRQLEALHPVYHGVEGTWAGDLLGGGLGTLFSPSRGLFVFSPWVLLGLLFLLFAGWRALPPLCKWLLPALAAYALLLSKYSAWWAGWSFGPRFWTDAIPLFVVLFCLGLERVRRRHEAWLLPAAALVLLSVGIHAVGAFAYPSTWNASPKDVDLAHERLWDWRDSEITRCLREGPHAPYLWTWPQAR